MQVPRVLTLPGLAQLFYLVLVVLIAVYPVREAVPFLVVVLLEARDL